MVTDECQRTRSGGGLVTSVQPSLINLNATSPPSRVRACADAGGEGGRFGFASSLPDYSETVSSGSAQFALVYEGRDVTTMRTELGAWVDTRFAIDSDTLIKLRGRAA